MDGQQRALNVCASEQGHISCHSAAQWDIVSNIIETLEPLEEVTLEIRYSKLMLQQEGPSSAGIKT